GQQGRESRVILAKRRSVCAIPRIRVRQRRRQVRRGRIRLRLGKLRQDREREDAQSPHPTSDGGHRSLSANRAWATGPATPPATRGRRQRTPFASVFPSLPVGFACVFGGVVVSPRREVPSM